MIDAAKLVAARERLEQLEDPESVGEAHLRKALTLVIEALEAPPVPEVYRLATRELWWKQGYRAAVYAQYMGHVKDPELATLVDDAWKKAGKNG